MTIAADSRFRTKLREQLYLLERGCAAFDQGHEVEAINLAVRLRVIFHDKGRTVSLLTHLGLKTGRMLSSSRGFGDWRGYLQQTIDLSSTEPVRMIPMLGDPTEDVSVRTWWGNQTVFVHHGQPYYRSTVILNAADKDGGAHVDKDVDPCYQALGAGEQALGLIGNLEFSGAAPFPQGVEMLPKNGHLALIRQFAHETFCSSGRFGWLRD